MLLCIDAYSTGYYKQNLEKSTQNYDLFTILKNYLIIPMKSYKINENNFKEKKILFIFRNFYTRRNGNIIIKCSQTYIFQLLRSIDE